MTDGRGPKADGAPPAGPSASPDRLFSIGSQNHQAGRLAAAEQQYRAALEIEPGHVNSLYFLGVVGLQTGRPDLAAEMIGKAVAIYDKNPDWHFNLGLAFERLGRFAEAVPHHQRALALKPGHVNAINHLGIAAMQVQSTDEAMAHFQRALAIDPQHVPTLMSLGNLHGSMGELAKAAAIYESIIKTRPNPVAFENLAIAHLTSGDPTRAFAVLQQGLRLEPTARMRQLFVQCALDVRATQADPALHDLVLRALTEGWGPALALANLASSLIKARPEVAAAMERAARAWPRRLQAAELFGDSGLAAIAADSLLPVLMEATHVADVEVERFLIAARAAFLGLADASAIAPIDAKVLRLMAALARYCFITEYAFADAPEERNEAQGLRDRLVAALQSDRQPPAAWVAAVAGYWPLHTLAQAQTLLANSWPDSIVGLLVQQVREPLEEAASRPLIVRLTDIEDRVSRQVRAQYEENPYPRWIRLPPVAPHASIDDHLRALLPAAAFKSAGKGGHFDILVAGCGTGPAVFELAQFFPGARILAIDLSLASLAYAQRKVRQAGYNNVEFAQADILKVGSIGRSFDLIDSRGVLHHMADALAGWRALASVLRPNGVMAIGLYSELARAHLVPARELIAARGYQSSAEGIRRFRQDVIDHPDRALFEGILASDDFFATSPCRDLLFHVHEDRLTLPQIDAFLKTTKLRMLGFELSAAVRHRYAQRFPQDRTMTDLESWDAFERDHPETFRTMYQFWVQRHDG